MKRSTPSTHLDSALSILRKFQRIDPEFPLQYAVCLIEVAQNEGISLTTLARRTNMPLSTISRVAGALSNHRKKGRAYGLIRVTVAPEERRRKQLYLTVLGQRILSDLANNQSVDNQPQGR